jgi:hypothetical protein
LFRLDWEWVKLLRIFYFGEKKMRNKTCKIALAMFSEPVGSRSMELYLTESEVLPAVLLPNTRLHFSVNGGQKRIAEVVDKVVFTKIGLVISVKVQPLKESIEVDSCAETWIVSLV